MTLPPEMIPARGSYLILRISGMQEMIDEHPTLDQIERRIKSNGIDTVTITYTRGGEPDLIMICDDTGMIDKKPVNVVATHVMCVVRPGYMHQIHGDVALVHDKDFE